MPPPRVYSSPTQERPGRIEYLYLTEEEAVVSDELNAEIDDLPGLTRLRCQIPQVRQKNGKTVAYFPHMDFDERTPPTAEQADLMCRTSGEMCPVAEMCLKQGLTIGAGSGVWGGKVLVDGEVYYKEETNG